MAPYQTFGEAGQSGQVIPDQPKWRRYAPAGALLVTALALLALSSDKSHLIEGTFFLNERTSSSSSNGANSLSLSVENEYKDKPGVFYPFVREGRIVEPYRESVLELSSSSSDEFDACEWTFTHSNGAGGTYSDSSTTVLNQAVNDNFETEAEHCTSVVKFSSPGEYQIDVTVTTKAGDTLQFSDSVQCSYVRREIHSIHELDWNRFLDTYQVLLTTPLEEGRRTFGGDFKSIDVLAGLHLRGAADRITDHYHDGLGFVTQHIALTNEFERSMQLITPEFSLPYWDYTIDEAEVRSKTSEGESLIAGYSSIVNSDLFSSKYFGNTGNETDPWHAISNGRFAYQKVNLATPGHVQSPYGYMRAPWNLNPSPYVTRYHQTCGTKATEFPWPSCATHYKLAFNEGSWYDMVWNSGLSPHGPVHIWIGGVGGPCISWDSSEYPLNLISEESLHLIKNYAFVLLKEAWRGFLMEVPKSCSIDDLDEEKTRKILSGGLVDPKYECRWRCNIENDGTYDKMFALLEAVSGVEDETRNLRQNQKHDIAKRIFCSDPYWPGDHLEAASAVEASFWPIHPTLERLVQYRLIANPFTEGNSTWENPNGDTDYCQYKALSDCKGHHPGDLTSFSMTTKDDSGTYQTTYLTNAEVRSSIDPTNKYKLPYIYDKFEWTHCDALGYKFDHHETVQSSQNS